MTTYISCSGRAAGNLKYGIKQCTRHYVTGPIPSTNGKHAAQRVEDPETQRELFVNVLNANATRRDAKQYLARFKPPQKSEAKSKASEILPGDRNAEPRRDQDHLERIGVNLGGMYAPARAIADTAQFALHEDVQPQTTPRPELHVALTCLKAPSKIDDATLDGLARTLAQLVRLDMKIVLVLDVDATGLSRAASVRALRKSVAEQADRLCDFIDRHNPEGARAVPNALELIDEDGEVSVSMPNLLLDPLSRGMIPIVPSLAYTSSGQIRPLSVSHIMTGLIKHFTGRDKLSVPPRNPPSEIASVDRVILLDPIGGIPSKDRGNGAHVFVNLQQEYLMIEQELAEYAAGAKHNSGSPERQVIYERHRKNMELARDCLELLPPSSSAVIVSPQEAASSSTRSTVPTLGAGTRRQKNPLIHNLLTNKPQVSSSLPAARFSLADSEPASHNATTVLRKGMPLVIIPAAPRAMGWSIPQTGRTDLDLENDNRVDLPRLVNLIEDSFRRKLDVKHYLDRVRGRVAGLIVAGDYEGGAILTWEMPPGADDPKRMVPYLDKFAVLQSSQGSSGVADIVFQAMVRTCFPKGVCWRSRKDNPVNKWYFERSAGTWQIPNSNWTMFWTGEGVVENKRKWNDYVGVCRDIGPSWADGRKPD